MIVVAGEALIDLVVSAEGQRAVPGGSPANVAVTLARLDEPVRLLARIGTDEYGRQLTEYLSANRVDLAWAVRADEPTSVAVATLNAAGQASYEFRLAGTADWQWTPQELPELAGSPATALHTGSLALALAPGAQVLEGLLAREHRRDGLTVSIDLNLRPSIVTDRAAEQARVRRQVGLAHLVKASDEDLAWLYPDRTVSDVLAGWREAGVSCAVVTRGGEGAWLLAPDGALLEQPVVRTTVVDTVGAGDSFTGGLLAALAALDALGDRPADRLAAVTAQQWAEVLRQAATVAALTCGRRGADPPRRAEVEALLHPTTTS
ncbi:carbohydrate kinase [Micromonospora sp. ALFpr18c]|uniref:carbohydrate kinase family protein n=1 Tax=unclassified Micromonospora TaxID=2617518 RepID=UPI00124B500D|nr:carbohydrate kinase [Micromonospora sp. ALFpr18c]KAB1944380.1 carbohydrate kinase [Micromonospora sp. ALFpr18c]